MSAVVANVRRVDEPAMAYSVTDVALLAVVVGVGYALKSHYSTATADDLCWALAPTTSLVELVTGRHFSFEHGAGFADDSRHLFIAPACAGVNFLIVAFYSLCFCLLGEVHGTARKVLFVSLCLFAAYASMIVVNAGRISAGLALGSHPGLFGGVQHADLHRIEGVVTYLTALWLLVAGGRWAIRGASR
ncbi:MAG TPA: exosortase K [Polyangiaceae bacterium]|jgi:exosortase K|nr:exosortase K [Polyangiaceae bacterium]